MSRPIRTIVVGVSHPAEDDPALAAAAELARWTGATLHLVHTFDLAPIVTPPELGAFSAEWAGQSVETQRGVLRAAARRTPGAESAVCHTIIGAPAPAILETAAHLHADLVLVGAARSGRLARAFLGTTAQRVLRGAEVPVLVVRRPLHRPLDRVLLTGDLSEMSAAVHERGLDTVGALFGEPAAARSLLVVVLPFLPAPLPPGSLRRAAHAELETFLGDRRPRAAAVEPLVRVGNPSEEIVVEAEAWDADLLVVGTHARGWAARLALGSAAEASLRDAPCNVLVVPPRAVAAEQRGAEPLDADVHPVLTPV